MSSVAWSAELHGEVKVHPGGGVAPEGRIVRAGRTLISRTELARASGLSRSALSGLYARRQHSGHPPAVYVDPQSGALYFDEEEALRWERSRRRVGRPEPVRLPRPAGDADDLVSTDEAARILGYHGAATIRSYISRFPDYFPAPDALEPLPNGRLKKLWRRATIWEFAARRRG